MPWYAINTFVLNQEPKKAKSPAKSIEVKDGTMISATGFYYGNFQVRASYYKDILLANEYPFLPSVLGNAVLLSCYWLSKCHR